MKSICEKINSHVEDNLFDPVYYLTLNQMFDRVIEQVYYDTHNKIHREFNMKVHVNLYSQIRNNIDDFKRHDNSK